jgi:hypothetical protein
VTPLAYVLIVVIPLTALVTVALALRPGRPRPGEALDSAQISARIEALDAQLRGTPADARQARELQRERRRLHDELLRRGLGRSV